MSDKTHFEGRSGVGGGARLVGMNASKDPSSLADGEHARVENMRVKGGSEGGILVSRGGQSKVNSVGAALAGCVEGIFPINEECQPPRLPKMWFNSRDNLFSLSADMVVTNEDPPFHPSIIIGHHDGAVWLRSISTVDGPGPPTKFRVSVLTDDGLTHNVLFGDALGGNPNDSRPGIFGETHKCPDGRILIPEQTTIAIIWGWDGALRYIELNIGSSSTFGPVFTSPAATFPVRPSQPFFTLGNGLTYAVISGGFWCRNSVSNWSVVATDPIPFVSMCTHTGILYGGTTYDAVTGGYNIVTWDNTGSTFPIVHTIPADVLTPGSEGIFHLFSFDSKLYYYYRKPVRTGGYTEHLGCYDGTYWDDDHFDFTDSTVEIGSSGGTIGFTTHTTAGIRARPSNESGGVLIPVYAATSDFKNAAHWFTPQINPRPGDMVIHTDSGQRSRLIYFIDE